MGKINVLSFEVANLIAAGEVVDRPASVIKELMENSIDAGAKKITVEIKNGGVSYMRVSDDGCGMAPEDMPLALKRHATSKIATADDLAAIFTLGFRGEALAAISSVSKVRVLSKTAEAANGAMLCADGGRIVSVGEAGCPAGTTITVEELPEGNSATGGSVYRGSVLPTMYKKLIENSLDILYDKLQESRDKQLVVGVSSYLMLAVYKMFRLLYEASPKNVSGMFRVGSARWDRSADAAMSMAEGDLAAALTGEDGTRDSLEPATLALSTDQLARDYPRHATSLFNLVKNAEYKTSICCGYCSHYFDVGCCRLC